MDTVRDAGGWLRGKWADVRTHLYLSMVLRLLLVVYGDFQDRSANVKFTDVDYKVFTDASRFVLNDQSPYTRHTYRYTPLLAWLLLPNVSIFPAFGKVLFCFFDILAGYLIFAYVRRFHFPDGHVWALRAACMWLYNPLVFTVSARGNAESVVITLVLASVYLYREKVFFLSGLCLAMAIHFKLYPVIYTLAMYAALTERQGLAGFLADLNKARLRFVLGTALTLALVTGLFYQMYGLEFIQHSYWYHLNRKDIRHNFSVYFYMMYLTVQDDDIGISLITFLPQVVLILALAKKFSCFDDIPFCLFCQTFVFVTFNKVCTSQYFLWYLCLLPLIAPKLKMNWREAITCLLWWAFTQGSWLIPAYFLEFKGYNTYIFIWIESLAFFSANVGLLAKLIRKYQERNSEPGKRD